MTDSAFTVVQAIIDRSGSMQSIRDDAEGGFNAFIADQRSLPGRCQVNLAQFDDKYEVVYTDQPIDQVPPLQILPRGSTALLDAIGRTVIDLGARLAALPEGARPGTVLVCIVTDGRENASREFSHPTIRDLIVEQTEKYSWTFIYLGADQDAIEQAVQMGIDAQQSLTYDRGSSGAAYEAMSGAVRRLRQSVAGGASIQAARVEAAFTDDERDAAR